MEDSVRSSEDDQTDDRRQGIIYSQSQLPDNRQGIIEVRKRRKMTRKDILKKYGFSWMSNVNLKEELSEQTAAEFEDLIRALAEHNRRPAPLETGWKKQMYNQFMKGAGR